MRATPDVACAEDRVLPSGILDVARIRGDFPILGQKVHGKPLVYLDSAATAQKPRQVLDALNHYYLEYNSNIHRGVHHLSGLATEAYEAARVKLQRFIGAREEREIIFVRSTTEAINLVAWSYGKRLQPGDEIVISALEHHSNIVPWQMLCEEKQARLRVVPINDRGEFLLDEYERLLNKRTRLVSVAHVSNALGTVLPVDQIVAMARRFDAPVLIDGAQAAPHQALNVQELDCGFYAFSGHKLFGPTGIGVLYGKAALLEGMPPYQGGGDMIRTVTFEKTTYNSLPFKFEAGTPHISGAIGLGAAVDYLTTLGMDKVAAYEQDLLVYATRVLSEVPQVRILGTSPRKAAVLSFMIDGVHPQDVGTVLDGEGIAVRTGHHCAQPVMDRYGVPATVRASLALYNTREDIDALARGIHRVVELFR
jgi:cysteine desulfurase/selenocysteine lyase